MTSPFVASNPAVSVRLPVLDGWRGIAICLVLIAHVEGLVHHNFLGAWSHCGPHGVSIFFVLSGFLITTKLLEPRQRLKEFYIKRFFRLMPVAWVYLATVWLLGTIVNHPYLTGRDLFSCVFFFRNFLEAGKLTQQFWSLSIEEQFYLIWPALLLLVGIRRARWLVAVAAVLVCLIRAFYPGPDPNGLGQFNTIYHADALLVGCLLALFVTEPAFVTHIMRWSKWLALPALAFLIICCGQQDIHISLAENLAIAVLIAYGFLHPASISSRALSTKGLTAMGKVSYSVYLWNFFFVMLSGSSWLETATMMTIMIAFSLASYFWIELPLTRMGHRIAQRTRNSERLVKRNFSPTTQTT